LAGFVDGYFDRMELVFFNGLCDADVDYFKNVLVVADHFSFGFD
jgi:hypothetical protein